VCRLGEKWVGSGFRGRPFIGLAAPAAAQGAIVMSKNNLKKLFRFARVVMFFTAGWGMFLSCQNNRAIEAAELNSVVINSVTADTANTGQRKLARAANGDLYAVYNRSDGKNQQIYFAKSVDNGAVWVEQGKVNADLNAEQKEPALAIDSADNLYVIWTGKGWGVSGKVNFNIQYRKFSQGISSWDPQESVTDIANDQLSLSFALDSFNNIHLAWSGAGWGTNTAHKNIKYTKRVHANTDWTNNRESVTDIANDQFSPVLALDSDSNIHIVWSGAGWGTNPNINNIQYRLKTAAWQAQESVTDSANPQNSPALALDSSNNARVVWFGAGWGKNSGINNIQYSKRAAASSDWSVNRESVTDKDAAQINPAIALDSADNVYVVWTGKGWGTRTTVFNIKSSKRVSQSADWSTNCVSVTDAPAEQNYPVLLWHQQPTIFSDLQTNIITNGAALIWNNSSGIKFYASAGIIWPKVYFVLSPANPMPTVGKSVNVTITASRKDTANADITVPGYSVATTVSVRADGAAKFTAPGSGNPISLTSANFKAGAAAATLTCATAQDVTLSAIDQNNTAISGVGTVSFQAAAANKLILNHPADIAVGTRAAFIAALADAYNNNVNAGPGGKTIYLFTNSVSPNAKFYNASSAGSAITSVTIAQGNSLTSFWYYDEAPGAHIIIASDATPANGRIGLADARDTIIVNPGASADYPVPATSPDELEKKQSGQLYELLVKVDDTSAKKARKKKPSEDQSGYQEGDIVMIKPAGYLWGAEERAKFVIVKAYLSEKQAREMMEPQTASAGIDEKGKSISKIVKKRKYKLDLTKEEFLGKKIKEFNQLLGAKELVGAGALVEKN